MPSVFFGERLLRVPLREGRYEASLIDNMDRMLGHEIPI